MGFVYWGVGLNYIWFDDVVTDADLLNLEIKKRLQMQYVQEWNAVVQNSSKGINHRISLQNRIQNGFLHESASAKILHLIASYRSTNMPIERGRWEDMHRSQRVCTLCNRIELRVALLSLKKLEECIDSIY